MNKKQGNVAIAIAIIIAGLIIAGAVMITNRGNVNDPVNSHSNNQQSEADPTSINPIDESDWVLGDINAPVKIVEYSDTECPFCGRLHETLKELLPEYEGQVAWVYRHFPVKQISPITANAQECVGELGGNDAFWSFSDKVYKEAGNNGGTNLEMLPQYATELGINEEEFVQCMEDFRHREKIEKDFNNAVATGGRGTPHSIILGPNGETIPISGALPKENWQSQINELLQ